MQFSITFLLSLLLGSLSIALCADLPLESFLDFINIQWLTSASFQNTTRFGWVQNYKGVKNVMVAEGPDFVQKKCTNYIEDVGEEISDLTFGKNGDRLFYTGYKLLYISDHMM